jgi:hypothetical protein
MSEAVRVGDLTKHSMPIKGSGSPDVFIGRKSLAWFARGGGRWTRPSVRVREEDHGQAPIHASRGHAPEYFGDFRDWLKQKVNGEDFVVIVPSSC